MKQPGWKWGLGGLAVGFAAAWGIALLITGDPRLSAGGLVDKVAYVMAPKQLQQTLPQNHNQETFTLTPELAFTQGQAVPEGTNAFAHKVKTFRSMGRFPDVDQPALHQAALDGDMDRVQRLLEKPLDHLGTKNGLEMTALHVAVLNPTAVGRHITQMLLEKGANPWEKDAYGRMPIHLAAMVGNFHVMKFLVDHAVPDEVDVAVYKARYQRTPSPKDISRTHEEPTAYAMVHARDLWRSTPLHLATDFSVAARLLHLGASLGKENSSGNSPLQEAVEDDRVELTSKLLDVLTRNHYGFGGMNAERPQSATLAFHMNRVDKSGRTLLHLAARNGNAFLVDKLMGIGWDKDQRCCSGFGPTPGELALKHGHFEVAAMLGVEPKKSP